MEKVVADSRITSVSQNNTIISAIAAIATAKSPLEEDVGWRKNGQD